MAIVVYGPAIALEAGNFTMTNILSFSLFQVTSWQDKTIKGLPEYKTLHNIQKLFS